CAQARWVAERMSVRLGECRMEGWTVVVRVTTSVSGLGDLDAQARAGPVPTAITPSVDLGER
ncbi:helicase, partial [Kibdelosporangium lantanae]